MDETARPDIRTLTDRNDPNNKPPADSHAMQDLKPFADQLMAIAQQLRDGEFDTAPAQRASPPARPTTNIDANQTAAHPSAQREQYLELARQLYANRRQRDSIFGQPDLFGEPAWDILLDLYIAFAEDKSVSVSSACIGSAAPPTTGLRWLGVLADQGLVVREADPEDQRRVLVRLTEHGTKNMDRYFASVSRSS
ncbi:MAG: winged helix DNA-binding protein [Pseudomonadota bacterium]